LKKKINRKENNIVFAGKLNESKGYNIFVNVILEILKKNKSWSCDIVGDEPRHYKKIYHPKIRYHGWLSHKKTMKIYEKSKIAVIPSLWNEPLGRTAIEAASRGCVSIISKRGGLVETNSHGLFLNYVTKKELFNKFGLYNTDYEIVADYEFFLKNIIINKSSNVHLNYFITEYNVEGFSSLPSNKAKEKAERLKVIKMYLSDEELKNIDYLLVEKNETLFMSVFKRLKKIIKFNGYKS
jgi:hypothetical protein